MFYLSTHYLEGEVVFPQKDPRVVFLKSVIDHLNHWEVGARGEEDFWITGDKYKQKAMKRSDSSSVSDRDGDGASPVGNHELPANNV